MASFRAACLNTLEHEGGYSNRPEADYGGETYMGISRRWQPDWPGWAIIDQIKAQRTIQQGEDGLLDVDIVLHFYKKVFWDVIYGDQIGDQIIANMVFDHAVTAGPADAAKLVQLACGAKVDGVIGPKTVISINRATEGDKRGFRRRLFKLRVCFYLEQAEKSLRQEANLPSWIARTCKTYA